MADGMVIVARQWRLIAACGLGFARPSEGVTIL
jgi:hypothetical protein